MTDRLVAICVPARNEAELLPRLVRSLSRQRGLADAAPLRLVIAANNCTDATVAVARELERALHGGILAFEILEAQFAPAEAHVGSARRLAMDRGADWLERDGASDGVLLTTDADAVAGPDWVAANCEALARADVVGGRLVISRDDEGQGDEGQGDEGQDDGGQDDAAADLDRRIERYWAAVRALEDVIDPPSHDPMPRHGDHTAASLALPVALYRAVGGLPTLACGEDNALVARVRRLGGRVRHCPHVEIAVSARRIGRVDGGMASEMGRRAAIRAGGGSYDLPPPLAWRCLFERRAALRRAWTDGSVFGPAREAVIASLDLDAADIAAISPETCRNDIAFVERAMLRDSRRVVAMPALAVDLATAGIEALVRDLAKRRPRATA